MTKTITLAGKTYRQAMPFDEAAKFFVIAKPEPTDDPILAAESKTFKNAKKRASELMAKRYNWHTATVYVEA